MDSVTQALLGASVAGVCAPPGHRRKALLVGAALGTLPDLDVFIDYGGAVENFTFHRGFSHSLFVLTPFSILLWLALKRWWAPVRDAPIPWLLAISLALITHPLLDAHTAYGTQLFWPMTVSPTMWSTMFIIDPLYTLPLLVGVIAAVIRPLGDTNSRLLTLGVVLSTLYLGWSWVGQTIVTNNAKASLAEAQLDQAPMQVTPTPFNTVLWRVLVMTEEGYMEAFDSLMIDEGKTAFRSYSSDTDALDAASDVWAVARLRWFARDFVKGYVEDNRLIVTDLRMGTEPSYVFNHVVAQYGNPHWQPIPTEFFTISFEDRGLSDLWQRIWNAP